jgi:hypothetical protein
LEPRCGGDCACAVEVALSLPAAAVLLSSSVPKLSVPDGWSYCAGLCSAPCKDTFAGTPDVTLYTGGLSQWNWTRISKDRAILRFKKYVSI